ncbi:formate dehydrogenase subunit gamma [Imbroritus primus]|uniref:formate dehydrogenase subunit gamma n=1 Tax=Imbroritus primus TaxID=3058603 RepID=UPI003D161792
MRSFWTKWLAAGLMALAVGAVHAQAASDTANPAPGAVTNPAINPPQPLANVASQNIFDVPPRDLAAEARKQKQRSVVQPGNNAPVWREVNSDQRHYSSLPDPEAGVLIQRTGQKWRMFRNGVITVYGGWLLVGVAVAILGFFLWRGMIPLKTPRTGRMIERFTPMERMVHWTMAISFVALAVSGIIMMFGKFFLLPLLGHTLFGWLTYLLKNIHNIVGPLFTLSIIVGFVMFVKDNLPRAVDWQWVRSFGGLASGRHVPSHRFNAGEKLWFWGGLVVFGIIVSISGWVLDMIVPGMDYFRGTMQVANIVHAIAATIMMAMAFGHIYMGTIGMEGAYRAMRDGWVDEAWAKEHHELWYDDIKSGKIPVQRSRAGTATPPVSAPRPSGRG